MSQWINLFAGQAGDTSLNITWTTAVVCRTRCFDPNSLPCTLAPVQSRPIAMHTNYSHILADTSPFYEPMRSIAASPRDHSTAVHIPPLMAKSVARAPHTSASDVTQHYELYRDSTLLRKQRVPQRPGASQSAISFSPLRVKHG